jgi:predicted transposase YbfD/YdcC
VEVEPEGIGFAHARSVIKVRRMSHNTKSGKETQGERRFITSLTVEQIGDGKALLATIRAHWDVENRNHWKRDANWREDDSRLRTPSLARLLALLRGALLSKIKGNAQEAYTNNAANRRQAFNQLNKKSI